MVRDQANKYDIADTQKLEAHLAAQSVVVDSAVGPALYIPRGDTLRRKTVEGIVCSASEAWLAMSAGREDKERACPSPDALSLRTSLCAPFGVAIRRKLFTDLGQAIQGQIRKFDCKL